ncbi:ATP12 family chaperone protein [Methylocapsa palsarum]|uniref:Chaperone required for the assembly of the F1-ATPase n=1 Tax=Methylocapsa palsarum TaxID=1612308 RepID=A0A1I3XW07_9HYPH|nr:ATP12 family protein [Methylocapsa palsarum]SFK23714.1 Chaperone required for the assembly of the F1-ATPase [Methylocapsa palsarum]
MSPKVSGEKIPDGAAPSGAAPSEKPVSEKPVSEVGEASRLPPIDPVAMARRDLNGGLPKRFYKEAAAQEQDGAYAVLLDGKGARTPARNKLALPTLAAAKAVAEEWSAQEEFINPRNMPLTRLVNSAIDGVAAEIEPTVAEIARYAGSDLVCYRAGEPEALVRAQSAAFDPALAFARKTLGALFICTEGVVHVEQPEAARRAVLDAVKAIGADPASGPFALAALHVMTTLTGSALLALAVAHGELSAREAWVAAHVDEDYQMKLWGADDEALGRRARRWSEMQAAAQLLECVREPD